MSRHGYEELVAAGAPRLPQSHLRYDVRLHPNSEGYGEWLEVRVLALKRRPDILGIKRWKTKVLGRAINTRYGDVKGTPGHVEFVAKLCAEAYENWQRSMQAKHIEAITLGRHG